MIRGAYEYIKGRLMERSTWVAIAQGATGAAVAPYPFNVVLFVAAIIGAMVPDSAKAVK